MGITIPITPLGVMPIWNSGWGKTFYGVFQIPNNATFIFNGCDRSGRAGNKDENLSLC